MSPTADWETRLRSCVREAIDGGRVPTPTDLNLAMTGRKDNQINGRWTKIRTEMLSAAGYRRYSSPAGASRWVPPHKEPPEGWHPVER